MTFTYCSPLDNDRDKVRLYVGDTNSSDALLQDEDIQFFLESEGSPKRAAAVAALSISAKFSRLADETVGQVRVSFSQKSEQYAKLADKLRMSADVDDVVPYAGGISISDKRAQEDDADRVPPAFERTIHENDRIPPSDDENLV